MTRKRESDATRRPHDKDQARQDQQAAATARRRRVAVAAAAAGAVVALVAVLALALVGGGDSDDTDTADDLAAVSGDDAPVEGATAGQPPADPGLCPEPGPAPVTDPVQVSEVPAPAPGPVTVTFETTCGPVVAELDGDAAPQAVGSLVALAGEGYFDSTPCHRLTTAGIFVLQCGDPTGTGTGGPGYSFGPVENAPADDVYPAGTFAMARVGNDGSSMGSQFFVVYEDSTIPSDAAGGYTVMGSVTSGLDIVQRVAGAGNAPGGEAPAQSIGIRTVTVQEAS
ncbi:MAG: peptidylprolyl isomerase [Actinomycetales bacterium]